MSKVTALLFFCMICLSEILYGQFSFHTVSSPDKKIQLLFSMEEGQAFYTVKFENKIVLKKSRLGLLRADEDFSKELQFRNASILKVVTDSYKMLTAKKSAIKYKANKRIFSVQNKNGQQLDIIFQVSDDGVAFRYFFPGKAVNIKTITQENTSFNFAGDATAWLQPMSVAKSGWERTNPAYEEHYHQNIKVGTPAPTEAGWVFPALFQSNDTWVLVTETSLDSTYCGSRLKTHSPGGEYSIGFADPRELINGGGFLPQGKLPFYTPWRIIAIGSLKTIIESTLGTDLAKPAIALDKKWIKPGKSSWSWIMSKDNMIVYAEQKRYIDLASEMHWQYCLIDADWDRKIGYDSIQLLAEYAKNKNVGLLLWYNSSGDWNTVKYTPKSRLLTHEDRVKEFSRLQQMGIKGVKIDFFGGDGQSVIQYYIDILDDAAKYGLLVNFHGATLPRGWHRTYPHLMTMEAVHGFEMVTFEQAHADVQANHCTMLPFTRNAFDPMDFTPMNLYKIPNRIKRKTTSAFELALSVLFLSGIQHFAESPEGMSHVPESIKQFLRTLPTHWDDVKFLDGYPGKYAVIARRSGSKWYVAGINGEGAERLLKLDLSAFKAKKGSLIIDGNENLFDQQDMKPDEYKNKELVLKPNGGFVIVLE